MKNLTVGLALTVLLAACAGVQSPSGAADQPVTTQAVNPFERGPAPTTASLEAKRGPYATTSTSVSRLRVSGFGGGTIYYPTTTSDGTFGAVAVSPGYTATQSSLS
ncbi:hypothetical protein Dcae01_01639 [Deinococcus caeni]|uniref:PET hydrolase/cutinase-like domain-containing protein n=1 Tax=Deinococcus caeni TaxID=569127 RepID=A0ABP9UFJ1_9DEIO